MVFYEGALLLPVVVFYCVSWLATSIGRYPIQVPGGYGKTVFCRFP